MLWGFPGLDFATARRFLGDLFVDRIESIFGPTAVALIFGAVAVFFVYLAFLIVRRLLSPARRARWRDIGSDPAGAARRRPWSAAVIDVATRVLPDVRPGLQLIIALLLALGLVFTVFPSQVLFLCIGPFVPFFVVFINVLRAVVIWTVLRGGREAVARGHHRLAAAAFLIVAALFLEIAFVQVRNLTASPPEPFGSAAALENYRGRTTVTNFQLAYTRHFTKEWSYVVGWNGEPLEPPGRTATFLSATGKAPPRNTDHRNFS